MDRGRQTLLWLRRELTTPLNRRWLGIPPLALALFMAWLVSRPATAGFSHWLRGISALIVVQTLGFLLARRIDRRMQG